MKCYADTVGTEYLYSKVRRGMVAATSRVQKVYTLKLPAKIAIPSDKNRRIALQFTGFSSPLHQRIIIQHSLRIALSISPFLVIRRQVSIFEVILVEENAGLLGSLDCSVSLSNLHRPHKKTPLFGYPPSSPFCYHRAECCRKIVH
jgi:hypothetical protein